MPMKLETCAELAATTERQLTESCTEWTSFLTTAGRLYKYPYHEQLMIYAQRPEATACAEYDIWNKVMGRYIRRGSKGIALIDTSGSEPKLRYVFDVADTGAREKSRDLNLWVYHSEYDEAVKSMLSEQFLPYSGDVFSQIIAVSENLTEKYFENHASEIGGILAKTSPVEYDISTAEAHFEKAMAASTAFTILSRCVDNPLMYMDVDDLDLTFEFQTSETTATLGTAISEMSEKVLRAIEKTIKTYERTKSHEERTELHESRRLPAPEPDPERAADENRQIRENEAGLPQEQPSDSVQHHGSGRETVHASVGNRADSEPTDGADDGRAGEIGGSDRRVEGVEPDVVGADDEQFEVAGGGDDTDRADLQLNPFGTPHRGEQISLFEVDIPDEVEQIEYIDKADERYSHDSMRVQPFAFSFSQDEIDVVLQFGSNTDNSRMRIVAEFMKDKSPEENAVFLRELYHGGNGFKMNDRDICAWYADDGIHLAQGRTTRYVQNAQVIPWTDAAERINELLEQGKFASNVEIAEAKSYEYNLCAEKLYHLYHDLSDEAKLLYFTSFIFDGTFPESVERISGMLAVPDMQKVISDELSRFADDYVENRDLLRFHYHKVNEMVTKFHELADMTREFSSEIAEIQPIEQFITEDEINELLSQYGSGYESGKNRIYEYFTTEHTQKEQVEFLKNEFGVGGHSHALSGSDGSDEWHDGKGIRLKKDGCVDVELSWQNVAKRIDNLIKQEKYLNPAEKSEYEAIKSAPTAYNEARNTYPDDILLYQVGDFFEMYGEDAKTAADKLDLHLTTRNLPDIGRVEMCGIPSNRLEQYIEDLRDRYDVTISSVNPAGERSLYRLLSVDHEAERDIDRYEAEFGADGRRVFRDVEEENVDANPPTVQQNVEEIQSELYSATENELPYDIVVEKLKTNEAPPPDNFRITDENLGAGGPKAKFDMNMNAIYTLKILENENRPATPEEQEELSHYVGWGGLAEAFDEDNTSWISEYKVLRAALTDEEYAAARASTLNAHYTSPTVIKAIYEAVGNMGFTSGNILEPSMGIGNFFGLLPDEMSSSKLYGVELDSITGRIAQKLYPNADITVAGFETTDRRDFFDLAVGNVPFGNYKVNDKAYNKLNFSIHDYFFAKTLDQVRPGGVIAFITSRYTMDKQSPDVRKYIAERADLLGAIRLPNNAFKANAGTEVTTDVIFLQKRDRPMVIEPDWVHLGLTDDNIPVNSYFVEHPEMILGKLKLDDMMYGNGKEVTCEPLPDVSLAEQLHEAIQHITGTYREAELPELGENETISKTLPADPNVKNYSYTVVNGDIYYRENSLMVQPNLNATAKERVKGMVELRDCVHELIDLQLNGASDDEICESQEKLNTLYDKFTKKHGLINDRANRSAFADDTSYYLLCSLEILDEDHNLKRKADMFTKRTIKPHEVVTSVDTAAESLAVSISEKAKIDMDYMAELTGKSKEILVEELRGVIFRLPESPETFVTADEYLSGNVREKLKTAEQYAVDHPEFSANVEALTVAQPKKLEVHEINVRLGATWIDKKYIQQFMFELMKPPFYAKSRLKVNYSKYTSEWNISGKSADSGNVNGTYTYGTERVNAYKILEETLNLRDVRVYDTTTDTDGKEKRVLNAKETTLAQQKQQEIKDAFAEWIWKSPERRHALVERYNELFNSTKPREYNGEHIKLGGMNPEITLREHQKNAVAHILYGGNTLLAHEVGAGKTFEMVAAAMESKRLGLCNKPLFAVPNHLTEQWASEFLRLYPSANILVATKKDFEPANRKKFCARIATGNYDAIIMGHSQFEKIPMSKERQEQLLRAQITEITDGIAELERSNAERFTVKQLERTRKNLEVRLAKLTNDTRKDDVVTFEQLGVDRLFVDEAHNYKNLFLYTKMRNVAGLSTTDAQKSSDMYAKCRYLDEITGSRGVVFATGTPVSNSMTELFTMMRYLQHDTLEKRNLNHFDAWASTFGETTTAIELAPEGTGYRARTRFAKFFNLPELMNLFKEAADIKTSDQLNLPVPKAVYHNIVAEPTEIQQEMMFELSERASKVHTGAVDPTVDNMLKITSDGRKLGLDQRLINSNLPDEPTSKVNLCVENVFNIWKETQAEKSTQLLFCDLSTPKSKTGTEKTAPKSEVDADIQGIINAIDRENPNEKPFTVYEDIRDKLIYRGVPKEEIAFIHDADTEVKKKELFAKVRSGNVRILLGSTSKMGAGTNCRATRSQLKRLRSSQKSTRLKGA